VTVAKITKGAVLVCLTMLGARVVVGQGRAQSPTFEAASVKLSSDQQRQRGVAGLPPPEKTDGSGSASSATLVF
jgi:hypothetical protein